MRSASRLVPPPHAVHPPGTSILHYDRDALHAVASSLTTVQEMCLTYTVGRRAGKVYPHEIDIQETQPKHRKLDSQAARAQQAR
jgi:hypothetical protein